MHHATGVPYQIVIGLEVHVQLLTRTKLFCGCSTQFGRAPNSATCPVCAGLPGALPVMNRRAFDLALKAALALQCEIPRFSRWDRKNYFYPDLPKNYQISQYDLPFSKNGWLLLPPRDGPASESDKENPARRIGIVRAHLEEDAGKMLHEKQADGGGSSLIDLNRAGTPLLEIVSRPDLRSPGEARAFLEELRLLLRALEVSDCEMQEGSLRCDANVNLHMGCGDAGPRVATPIVEIKNLNSFRNVERATQYEAERQYLEYQRNLGAVWRVDPVAAHHDGHLIFPVQELRDGQWFAVGKATAGWHDKRGVTEVQRRKEESADYRYFPEPDLVPVIVDAVILERIQQEIGELPAAQRERLQSQYGLSLYDAGVLIGQGRPTVAYFDETVRLGGNPKEVCNWLANEVLSVLNDRRLDIRAFPIAPTALAALVEEIARTGLNKQRSRAVFSLMLESGKTAQAAIAELGYQSMADESQLIDIIRRALAANPKAVVDYKKGKHKAADAIKGAVMRETRGMANTEMLEKLLLQELR